MSIITHRDRAGNLVQIRKVIVRAKAKINGERGFSSYRHGCLSLWLLSGATRGTNRHLRGGQRCYFLLGHFLGLTRCTGRCKWKEKVTWLSRTPPVGLPRLWCHVLLSSFPARLITPSDPSMMLSDSLECIFCIFPSLIYWFKVFSVSVYVAITYIWHSSRLQLPKLTSIFLLRYCLPQSGVVGCGPCWPCCVECSCTTSTSRP